MVKIQDYREKIYDHYRSSVRQNVEVNRNDYERRINFYKKRFRKYLPINKDAEILDIGCGEGFFLYFMDKIGYKNLYGVEKSPEQIEVLNKVSQKATIFNQDIFNFFQDNTKKYDLVLLDNVLEHFNKNEIFMILESIHNILTDKGMLIIDVPNGGSPWGVYHCFMDFTHEVFFTPTSLMEVLLVNGYKITKIKGEGAIPLDLLSSLRSIFYYPLKYITLFLLIILTGGGGRTKILHLPDPHIICLAEKK